MATRPTNLPLWCTQNPTNRVQPATADVATGYIPGEPLPAQYLNGQLGNIGDWVSYLDEQQSGTVLASSLDFSTRLLGGGVWSYKGTALAWDAAATIAIPSQADGNNTLAAGSVNLPAGYVAYVTANVPFSTTATTTNGSNVLSSVLYADAASVGQAAVGAGIPSGAQVTAVGTDGTVTLSQSATASAAAVTVTFSSSGTLTPQTAASSSLVPGPNTVVFARALTDSCIVGVTSGQMHVRQNEAKTLLGAGYLQTQRATAALAISAGQAAYVAPSGDSMTFYLPAVGGSNVTTTVLYLPVTSSGQSVASPQQFAVGDVLTGYPVTSSPTTITSIAANGAITVSSGLTWTSAGQSPNAIQPIVVTRQAGLAYLTDASQFAPAYRASLTGISAITAAAGSITPLICTGQVNGLSALQPNTPYYEDPANLGALTATKPTTAGQQVVPVGTASSATTLLLNAAAAYQAAPVPAVTAYKSVVNLGYYWNTNTTSAGLNSMQQTILNDSSKSTGLFANRVVMDRPGSIVGLSAYFSGLDGTTGVTLYIGKATGTLFQVTAATSGATAPTYFSATFPKGTYSFSATEPLMGYVQFSKTGVSVLTYMYCTVEMAP